MFLKRTFKSFLSKYPFFSYNKDEQLEEIDDIIEMKVSHRKNIKRRRERFGIESNSILGLDVEANANVIAPEDGDEENPFGDD